MLCVHIRVVFIAWLGAKDQSSSRVYLDMKRHPDDQPHETEGTEPAQMGQAEDAPTVRATPRDGEAEWAAQEAAAQEAAAQEAAAQEIEGRVFRLYLELK